MSDSIPPINLAIAGLSVLLLSACGNHSPNARNQALAAQQNAAGATSAAGAAPTSAAKHSSAAKFRWAGRRSILGHWFSALIRFFTWGGRCPNAYRLPPA